jgi:hypothetical protein
MSKTLWYSLTLRFSNRSEGFNLEIDAENKIQLENPRLVCNINKYIDGTFIVKIPCRLANKNL